MFPYISSPNTNVLFRQDTTSTCESENIFDDLPALIAPAATELCGELDRYLSTDPEHVTDVLAWWYARRAIYPRLHQMALDYLTIPGVWNTTVFKYLTNSCFSNIY